MFERKSHVYVPHDQASEEQLMNLVLDAGADDLRDEGDQWEVVSPPEAHEAVVAALEKAKLTTESAEVAMLPKNLVRLEGKNAGAMLRLSEALEEQDDVQNVYSNFDIDEKELEALAQ
jgi:transcriptional/translational regulatory protein YebC/TACO1